MIIAALQQQVPVLIDTNVPRRVCLFVSFDTLTSSAKTAECI